MARPTALRAGAVLSTLMIFALLGKAAEANVVSLYGDIDCFGLPGVTSCPNGSLWETGLGGVFFTDYRDPAELAANSVTDIWASPGSVTYLQTYSLPTGPISATLSIKIAGIHDINQGTAYNVLFDGTNIGVIPPNLDPNAFQEVLTYNFTVPVGLLTGNDTVSWSNTGGDGYIIDYSELTITTAVPEPASLALLSTGLVGIALVRRRRWIR